MHKRQRRSQRWTKYLLTKKKKITKKKKRKKRSTQVVEMYLIYETTRYIWIYLIVSVSAGIKVKKNNPQNMIRQWLFIGPLINESATYEKAIPKGVRHFKIFQWGFWLDKIIRYRKEAEVVKFSHSKKLYFNTEN